MSNMPSGLLEWLELRIEFCEGFPDSPNAVLDAARYKYARECILEKIEKEKSPLTKRN